MKILKYLPILIIFGASALLGQTADVQALAAAGTQAAAGNNKVVTVVMYVFDAATGNPVNNVTAADVTVTSPHTVLGQTCYGAGGYKISNFAGPVPNASSPGYYEFFVNFAQTSCTWVKGDYQLAISITKSTLRGQVAVGFKIQ